MLQRTTLLVISICLIAVASLGCSQPARDHLTDAQSNAASAAKDTGRAMASDAKATGNAISGALDKAASSQVQLPARIEEAIRAAPDIQAVNISVTASDKKLTLEGKVTSKAQRRRAKEIASTIAGDKFQIDDHLKINGDQ